MADSEMPVCNFNDPESDTDQVSCHKSVATGAAAAAAPALQGDDQTWTDCLCRRRVGCYCVGSVPDMAYRELRRIERVLPGTGWTQHMRSLVSEHAMSVPDTA
eukprot:2391451-Rhodomonas_salina.4